MFTRWNLARNPFDTNPISLANLDWFIGRKKEIRLCQNLVQSGSVVLIEGGLGVGTTSFGNVVRFRGPVRTPKMELAVYRGWNVQTLFENVLVAIVQEISEDAGLKKSQAVRKVKSLVQRVEKAVHSAGISLLGFGGQISRNMAVTQPGIVPLETLRQSLTTLSQIVAPEGDHAAFVIQLNNLDPDLTFTADELTTFLNDIRDSLQLPGFGWLIVGKKGLSRFITSRVPRIRSIIAHDVSLAPLTFKEVKKVVAIRINACALPGHKAKNPIDPELLQEIYDASGGSLRETFLICGKLCAAMSTDPLYEKITKREAGVLLAELLGVRFAGIRNSPLQQAILNALVSHPGITQQQLVKRIGKSQTAVSRATKSLIESELVRQTKDGRSAHHWAAPEVRLAAEYL